MLVVQIGNHGPAHSTETHLRRALEDLGHTVRPVQEGPVAFRRAPQLAIGLRADLVLWTHTHGLAPEATELEQRRMIDRLRDARIPVVSYHLDRWWGLDREEQIRTEPFFRTDLVCTADGGGPWDEAEVVHEWFPPAVLASECLPGTPREEYRSEIAFVGSWQGGYHAEWTHRPELIRFLRDRYRDRVRFWPRPGEHAVRGVDLRDLYASVDVVVGDSCLVPYSDGSPVSRYCSDRIPETLGRGAAFLHPLVPGVVGPIDPLGPNSGGPMWEADRHLVAWNAGDWEQLERAVEWLLESPAERRYLRDNGREHTLRYHTYETRMVELEASLKARGLVSWSTPGAVERLSDRLPS